jgi:hypothetical protein
MHVNAQQKGRRKEPLTGEGSILDTSTVYFAWSTFARAVNAHKGKSTL